MTDDRNPNLLLLCSAGRGQCYAFDTRGAFLPAIRQIRNAAILPALASALNPSGTLNDPRSVLAVKRFAYDSRTYDSRTKYPSHTLLRCGISTRLRFLGSVAAGEHRPG